MSGKSQSGSTPPFISVIVVNFNGKKFLQACLSSLENQDYPKERLECILVDNGSTDGSVELVESSFPWVHLVEAGKNLGFAGGNNLGMRVARGDFFALLNNDTETPPDWVSSLVQAIQHSPSFGMGASKILLHHDHGIINSTGLILLPDGRGKDRGFHERDLGQFEKTDEVFGACGAGVLLRREMLEEIGLFDERLFMYYEDLDLAWRAKRAGWKCVYAPKARVYHIHCGSSGSWSPFFTFHVERNRALVSAKNAGLIQAVRSVGTVFAKTTMRIIQGVVPGERFRLAGVYCKVALSLFRHLPAVLFNRWFCPRANSSWLSKNQPKCKDQRGKTPPDGAWRASA
ncbi:MAG: glycosyltransferase family 2 protein [Gemmataceae bacterium]|nr:glycosyltransferase family 2 protein [Gemmataceae bacterium]